MFGGGGGMGGPDGMDFGDEEGPEGETEDTGNEGDSTGTGWDELEAQQSGQMEKSMSNKDLVRIIV
jgi:hypothetical protein